MHYKLNNNSLLRLFHSSPSLAFPRMPFNPKKQPLPTPAFPVPESLSQKSIAPPSYPTFPSRRYPPAHIRLALPKPAKRSIEDVLTCRPLPTTFPPGVDLDSFYSPQPVDPLPEGEYHFPYRYYQITLRRGLMGLPATTKHIVQSLGLHKRHQVVWRLVSPRSAGQILKIKELVHVSLVNEIPAKETRPSGYAKAGSSIPALA